MPYVNGFNRDQVSMISWDDMIPDDSLIRVIDAFVDSLDLKGLGFKNVDAKHTGRAKYNPWNMLKLYLYGHRYDIRSSRKLCRQCRINIEVRWLMEGVEPDYRTISDFRKDNVDALKNVFLEFNKRLEGFVETGFQSVDGSKFKAWCSKDRNFTASKLDDRVIRMETQIAEYMRQLELNDDEESAFEGDFTREELEEKLNKTQERLEKYRGYLKLMEDEHLSQISLTDADAKLMKNNNGFDVSYNVQTAVDSGSHLITNYEMTNECTDHGQLMPTLKDVKKDGEIMSSVADKGYDEHDDMAECLMSGIIPNVIQQEGKDSYELETEYGECSDAESLKGNTDSDSLRKCIKAGTVPEAYKDIISDIEVKEKRYKVYDGEDEKNLKHLTEEAMKIRASKGYFVRDIERNLVYCPGGAILRQKSEKKDGTIRYCNKLACRNCPYKDRCMKNKTSEKYKFKEIDFRDKQTEKPCKTWTEELTEEINKKAGRGYHFEKKKIVKFKFRPNRHQMDQRKSISEHPFGTIKRAMHSGYFLLRSKRKVNGEFALFALGYNIQRAFNLLGFEKMMAIMG